MVRITYSLVEVVTVTGCNTCISQPDSLLLPGHLVMFQSNTLQGQADLVHKLFRAFDIIYITYNSRKTTKKGPVQVLYLYMDLKFHAIVYKLRLV